MTDVWVMTDMSEDLMGDLSRDERIEAVLYAGTVYSTQEAAMAAAQEQVDDYMKGLDEGDLEAMDQEGWDREGTLDWTATTDQEGRVTATAVHEMSGYQYAVRQEKVHE